MAEVIEKKTTKKKATKYSKATYLTWYETMLRIIKIEKPTVDEIALLQNSYQLGEQGHIQREKTYNNMQNLFYSKLFFLNTTMKNYLFSAVKNAAAIIT